MASWFPRGCWSFALALCALTDTTSAEVQGADIRTVGFVRDIAPIFKESCYDCHSGKHPQGELRLDSRAAALRGGFSGPGIVTGSAKKSEIYQRISSRDPELRMPHQSEPLPPEKIELIRLWIDRGADWPDSAAGDAGIDEHWAYVKPL